MPLGLPQYVPLMGLGSPPIGGEPPIARSCQMAVSWIQGGVLTALSSPQLGPVPAAKLLHLKGCLARTAFVEEVQQKSSATAACLHPAQNRQHAIDVFVDQSWSLLDQVMYCTAGSERKSHRSEDASCVGKEYLVSYVRVVYFCCACFAAPLPPPSPHSFIFPLRTVPLVSFPCELSRGLQAMSCS